MSITINTSPTGTPSAQDALWHVCSSTNSGETDMRYVFDVIINAEQKIRVKKYPEPVTGKGYFDVSSVVKNSFLYDWFVPLITAYLATPDDAGQIAIKYTLQVGEDVGGVTTTNMANVDVTVYNYTPPLFQRRVFTIADKLNQWLTNRPLVIHAGLDENIFLPFYTDSENVQVECKTYDETNTLIDFESDAGDVNVPNGFIQMNIGSAAIMDVLPIVIDDTTKYYDVNLKSFGTVRVILKCNHKYTTIPIHFVNAFGMWETLHFDLVSRLMMDIERKSFAKRDYRFNGTAVDYIEGNVYHETKINHLNKADFIYKLTADAMTDGEYIWAAELIYSPQLLMEVDGYFYPVTIKNTNYEFSKHVNNKLKALEIEVEVNQTRYSHLR